jgi:hypothetical protein
MAIELIVPRSDAVGRKLSRGAAFPLLRSARDYCVAITHEGTRRADRRRMPTERLMPEMVASLAVPGAAEWLALSDDLLGGLVHALNNRVTALSVCAELAALGDRQMLGEGVLAAEVARLQRASALIGLLPARGHPEALEIAAVLDDALSIHANHPRMRTVECSVRSDGDVQPVRAPRWAMLRLLLIMVDAAKASAWDAQRSATELHISGDERAVQVRAAARGVGGAYAAEMAALCGGALARDEGGLVLTLPSLTELRRRERSGHTIG